MEQVLISNPIPPLLAGRAAGLAAVPPLINTYILNRGKEDDAVVKISPEFFWDL